MSIFIALLCVADVVFGIVLLFLGKIPEGIALILNALIFMYAAAGASQTFINQEKVKKLEEEVEALKKEINQLKENKLQ